MRTPEQCAWAELRRLQRQIERQAGLDRSLRTARKQEKLSAKIDLEHRPRGEEDRDESPPF